MGWLNYVVLVLYIVGMVGIAVYTRRKAKTMDDFLFAGSKGLNGWMSAFAYGTTYFSAVIFIGYAGKFGWNFGLSSIWIGIGNAVIGSLIAWLVLAKRTRNMTQRLQAKTMPQFFEKRYESGSLKLVSSIIIFVFLIPYSVSVYNGLSYLFSTVFGIPSWAIILILATISALYLFFGGYMATSLSDFIQGIIMLVGVVLMVILFMNSDKVNWSEGIKTLVDNDLGFFVGSSENGRFLYDRPMTVISLVLLTSFGVWGLPQTIHKYYAIRDRRAIKQGTIISTVFALIIGSGAYFVGALGTLFFDKVPEGNYDTIVPKMMLEALPNGVIGLIAVLVLAASMSTLSSVSLSSASVVSIDMYKGYIKKDASEKNTTFLMRIMCIVFIVISVILAILNDKFGISAIAYLMGLSWGTLAGCFIGPYVLGIISKKSTKTASWVSIIGTLVITFVLLIVLGYDKNKGVEITFGKAIQDGISMSPLIGVICMAYSMLSTFIVSLFTKKPSQKAIDEAFNKEIENEVK